MSDVPLHQYMCKNRIEDENKTLTDSTRKKKDNSAKYNKTRVCIFASQGLRFGVAFSTEEEGGPES